ncbi:hypothetical protein Clacol_005424 [Clathrus columnatus]|uniref:diacylglycerol O-acyltransferase n=1 Tax=Clathrus columnatus TaxID=1419009 RepID=A0AAV5A988_9AGAM|nr:hypothetical protein Clacol_005424 [Clathrus columnatus]
MSKIIQKRISRLNLKTLNSLTVPNISIEFAPARIPPKRRRQTAAVAVWAVLMPITLTVFFLLCSIPILWPAIVAYLIWIHIDPAPERGGRPTVWMRELTIWRHFAQYYPISLKKETDLPPDRPYIFGYHPHGIIGMGAMANFATESTYFSQSFPDIKPHLLTLASNFRIPIYRDILLSLGICSVSKVSCASILSQGAGQAITIVVGGAAESLRARPGTNELTLKRRLGFIKLAIQYG